LEMIDERAAAGAEADHSGQSLRLLSAWK
jgi:hypothetical protein